MKPAMVLKVVARRVGPVLHMPERFVSGGCQKRIHSLCGIRAGGERVKIREVDGDALLMIIQRK